MLPYTMLHFIFIVTGLFASTSAFITRPLQEPGQSCDYRELHLSPQQRADSGKNDSSLWPPEPSGVLIPNIRRAAPTFKKHSPSSMSYDECQKDIWPYFDRTPELFQGHHLLDDTPLGLLTIIYTPSICHPFNRGEIWQENFENSHIFQTIEHLAERSQTHRSYPLLLQLHTIGSLMLAGISKTMYHKLDLLFKSIRCQLGQIYCYQDLNLIGEPQKSCFLDSMHPNLLPFQRIGLFAHITRWMIVYRKSLSVPGERELRKNMRDLHKILTEEINRILSPGWYNCPLDLIKIDVEQWRTECFTAAWIPDGFLDLFTEFAQTQDKKMCQFQELMQHYEDLAKEAQITNAGTSAV